MPVRTAYAGTAVPNEILTATNVNRGPGGWIGYNEATANQTGITTETALFFLSASVTVGTSRRIRVSVQGKVVPAAGATVTLRIKEGATVLQVIEVSVGTGALAQVAGSVVLTPIAGAHTYAATLQGSSSVDFRAGATDPAFILVEDIGPAT